MPSICWKDHADHITRLVAVLYNNSELTDCMLDTEGGSIQCHKTILAACSPYFKKLFMDHVGTEIIPFKQVNFNDMKAILNFIYYGKVDLSLPDMDSLRKTAELLQISALTQAFLDFSVKCSANVTSERVVGTSGTVCSVNLKKNAGSNLSVQESSEFPNQDALPDRRWGFDSSVHPQSVGPGKDSTVNDSCEASAKVSIPDWRMGMDGVCEEDPEDPEEGEMKPITFVAVSPVSDVSEEFDGASGGSVCVTDPLLGNSLEENSYNCESTEGGRCCGSVSRIKRQDNPEVDVEGKAIVSVPFACKVERLCDEWTRPLEGDMLLGGVQQSNQRVSVEPLVATDKTDGGKDCEVKSESICDIFEEAKNEFVMCEGESLKCGGAVESCVVVYRSPSDIEVGYDRSASNVSCGSQRIQVKHTRTEKKIAIGRKHHQETLNCALDDVEIASKKRCDLNLASFTPDDGICLSEVSCKTEFTESIPTGQKYFTCGFCKQSFSEKTHLKKHVRSHSRGKPYKCVACDASFTFNYQLLKHIRTHTGEKPYKCVTCDASFTTNYQLLQHTRTHTGEKPYKCVFCGASFTDNSQLLRHTRTHTGEKPYACVTCGAAFTQSSSLVSHTRTHTGEKPYACVTCGAAFARSSSLVSHTRTHTGEKPYACVICGASFTQSSSLMSHTRTHTREKPYKCVACDASFPTNSRLLQHIRTHTGVKPFKCVTCDASFTSNSLLLKHTRTHAVENPIA